MATMINDPKAVKKLRNNLCDTVSGLNEQLKKTENAMEAVAREWKDEQFRKYNEEFVKDKEKITPLCKDIEKFEEEVLQPFQKILEKYLSL